MKIMDKTLRSHVEKLAISKDPEKIDRLMKDVKNYYFGNEEPLTKEAIPSLIRLLSDIYFCCPTNMVVEDRRKRECAPTYLYKFSYIGDETTITRLLRTILPKSDNSDYYPKGTLSVIRYINIYTYHSFSPFYVERDEIAGISI